MIFNPIVQKNTIISATTSDEWIRPTDWIPIPDIATGEEVVYMLNAVYDNNSNFIAFLFQGNYTVDWGDGNIENVNSNIKAEHQYNYADCGNLSERGYKQALIKVTPQGGQHLSYINLQQTTNIGSSKNSYVLDIILNVPYFNLIYDNLFSGSSQFFPCLERFFILEIGNITTTINMFSNMTSLQSIPLFNTSNVISMQYMFSKCNKLKSVPLFNTSNVLDMSYMFEECHSLITIPLFDTSSVTTMHRMFFDCFNLNAIPVLNVGNVTTMVYMFYTCKLLESVEFNTISTPIDMSYMFYNCSSLKYVTLGDLGNVVTFNIIFYGVTNQTIVRLINLKKSTEIAYSRMSANELNNVGNYVADLTDLPSASINVVNTFGAGLMDTSIWTNKNWTIIR